MRVVFSQHRPRSGQNRALARPVKAGNGGANGAACLRKTPRQQNSTARNLRQLGPSTDVSVFLPCGYVSLDVVETAAPQFWHILCNFISFRSFEILGGTS
jgi:hypothetical protein